MNRKLIIIFISVAAMLGVFFLFNIDVTYEKGVNYKWASVKIPLYLKILDFFDRHYHYKHLSGQIVSGGMSDEEKALALLRWTHENIKKVPQGMPVIDDHTWYIIVRGYGARDQVSDVFSTLSNYAGLSSVYLKVYSADKSSAIPLSFVRINGYWTFLDPYEGVYFAGFDGKIAPIEKIKDKDRVKEISIGGISKTDYGQYLDNIPVTINPGFKKSAIQSPFNRLFYEIKERLK